MHKTVFKSFARAGVYLLLLQIIEFALKVMFLNVMSPFYYSAMIAVS